MTDNDFTQRPPDALPLGYRFEEFEIQDVLDAGNDNIVYRAQDHQLERQVAIREFLPRTLTVRSESQRLVPRSKQDQSAFLAGLDGFIHEARQLARLNHPNVVQILRFWTYNETAYAATPVYSGMTLTDLLQHYPERINEAWIRRMLPMLCGALAALHDKGFIHCRLSLNSIQIQDNGLPLLLEFGALRQTGENGEVNKTLLHPGFTPLEQYSDDADNPPGPWTDIYSLGAILYTLITGARPPTSVTRSIQDNCVPLTESQPEGYSPELLQAIDRTLALRPEERPQSIEAFTRLAGIALNDTGMSQPVQQTGSMLIPVEQDEPEEPTVLPWWKAHRVALQTAAGVLVGLIAGALLFGRSTSTPVTQSASISGKTATATSATKPAAAASALTRVYLRVNEGDELEVNGKVQKMPTPVNGYATVQLTPGQYEVTLRNGEQSRSATITVDKPGTWLLDPQP